MGPLWEPYLRGMNFQVWRLPGWLAETFIRLIALIVKIEDLIFFASNDLKQKLLLGLAFKQQKRLKTSLSFITCCTQFLLPLDKSNFLQMSYLRLEWL